MHKMSRWREIEDQNFKGSHCSLCNTGSCKEALSGATLSLQKKNLGRKVVIIACSLHLMDGWRLKGKKSSKKSTNYFHHGCTHLKLVAYEVREIRKTGITKWEGRLGQSSCACLYFWTCLHKWRLSLEMFTMEITGNIKYIIYPQSLGCRSYLPFGLLSHLNEPLWSGQSASPPGASFGGVDNSTAPL